MKQSIQLDRQDAEDLADTLEAFAEVCGCDQWERELSQHASMIRDKLAGRIE